MSEFISDITDTYRNLVWAQFAFIVRGLWFLSNLAFKTTKEPEAPSVFPINPIALQTMQIGVYIYLVEILRTDGSIHSLSGEINLVR